MTTLNAPERPEIAVRVGDPRATLSPAVAANMLARLTRAEIERAEPDVDYVGIMTDPALRTCGAIFDACIGSLTVLGYGRPWLARALRVDDRYLIPGKGSREIDPKLMHRALTAAIRIGSRWATPESTGQSAEEIEDAQQQALAACFRVPAAYDNRYGGLPSRVARRRKRTQHPGYRSLDERIVAKIKAVAYFCEHGGTTESVGARFDLSARTVGRTRYEELGIEVVAEGLNTFRVAPGQEDIVAAVIAAANALAIEDPREVYAQLRAFAVQRQDSLAARQAARAAAKAAATAAAIARRKARRAALLEENAQRDTQRQDNAA